MKRAKKLVPKLLNAIKSAHTPALREGKPVDIADAYMELHRQDQQFMPETDLAFPFAAGLVASLYMGNALAFAMYNMIKHPDVYERVAAEGEALFADGRIPDPKELDGDKVDVTRRVFLESERLYPVIPVQLRTVMNRCIVAGVELEPQTLVMIGHTGTHYMEEYLRIHLNSILIGSSRDERSICRLASMFHTDLERTIVWGIDTLSFKPSLIYSFLLITST